MIRYKSWAIPEGNVVKVTDESGRVLWVLNSDNFDGTLKVKKITSNTYAGETTYNNEQFILLDIYPKTNGTVSVTYGGLTKIITDTSGATNPNAKKYNNITYDDIIIKGLKVMDTASCALCKQNSIPIVVFDFAAKGSIIKILKGENIGTYVGG